MAPTLEDLAPRYLEVVSRENAPSTVRRKRGILARLCASLGPTQLDRVCRIDVERYREARRAEVSGPSVNRELATLSHLMAWACRTGLREGNPVRGVPRFPENRNAWRALTPAEAKRLLDACRRSGRELTMAPAPTRSAAANHVPPSIRPGGARAPHLHGLVLLALYTGLRRGELLGLRWNQVDLDAGTLEILRGKTGERSLLPLHPRALEFLRRWRAQGCVAARAPVSGAEPETGAHVFTHPDGRPIGDVKRSFATAVRRAGLAPLRWHDLRHTFASWLVLGGADLFTVQELMGHRNLSMTRRYAHLSMRHKRDAVGRIGETVRSEGS